MRNDRRRTAIPSTDGSSGRRTSRLAATTRNPSVADEIGEAAGGISGVLARRRHRVGGWTGRHADRRNRRRDRRMVGRTRRRRGGELAHARGREPTSASTTTTFRTAAADRGYDDVRGAYYLGQIASHNPNFLEREFDEVEPELEGGWASYGDKHGTWTTVRDYAAEGFRRGRSKLDDSARRAIAEQSGTHGEQSWTTRRARSAPLVSRYVSRRNPRPRR